MGAKRRMRSLAARRRLARRWVESGLTAREFALVHDVSRSSLNRWARELRESAAPVRPAGFIEVTPAAVKSMAVKLRVGGVTLELDRLPPAEYVVALGAASC